MRLRKAPESFTGQDEFQYTPRRWIRKGDRVRISGGPIWIDAAGVRHRVGERGVFVFCFAAVDGKGRPYIVVSGKAGASVCLPLGEGADNVYGVSGWHNEAYRVRRLRARTKVKGERPK